MAIFPMDDGAETNCGIARILGILLISGYGNKISTGATHQIVVCPLRALIVCFISFLRAQLPMRSSNRRERP